jgi:hypothetical protein
VINSSHPCFSIRKACQEPTIPVKAFPDLSEIANAFTKTRSVLPSWLVVTDLSSP